MGKVVYNIDKLSLGSDDNVDTIDMVYKINEIIDILNSKIKQ